MMNNKIFNRTTAFAIRFFESSIDLNPTLPHWITFHGMVKSPTNSSVMTFTRAMFSGFLTGRRNFKRIFTEIAEYFYLIIVPRDLSFLKWSSTHISNYIADSIGSQEE